MRALKMFPIVTNHAHLSRPCAKLILEAEIECGASMSATNRLFGEEVARTARKRSVMSWISAAKVNQKLSVLACLGLALILPGTAIAQQEKPSAGALNELGAEGNILAQRVGVWDVTETVWASPDAAPVTTKGLVAERLLMGTLLQEVIRQPGESLEKTVKRTDLLSYNRLEGRWGYVSFDTRAPVGLMPAWSTGRGDGSTINLTFTPFAVPGSGVETTGQFILMEQTIHFDGPDHDVKDQYFTLADGRGVRWLAHRYAYTRRP